MWLPVVAASAHAQSADLSMEVSATPRLVHPGDTVTFELRSTNHGPRASTMDSVAQPGSHLRIVSVTCPFGVSPDGWWCEPGTAMAGQTWTMTVTAVVLQAGTAGMRGCATSEGDTTDPDASDDCDRVVVLAR